MATGCNATSSGRLVVHPGYALPRPSSLSLSGRRRSAIGSHGHGCGPRRNRGTGLRRCRKLNGPPSIRWAEDLAIQPSQDKPVTMANPESTPTPADSLLAEKCFVCGVSIPQPCFCKLHLDGGRTLIFCSPKCLIKHLDTVRPPTEIAKQQLENYERKLNLFVFAGGDKPWQ